jgi:hypothetical protein
MEQINYLIYFLIGFYVLNILKNQIKVNTIINIVIAIGLIYLYEKYKNKNIFTSNKKSKKIENKPKIKNLMNSLKEFKKFNKDAVKGSLKHLNNFFTIIDDLDKGIVYQHFNIDIADQERKNALNLLSSIIISIPSTNTFLREKKIQKVIDELSLETLGYLKNAIDKNNQNTKSNYDITKKIVNYFDDDGNLQPQPKDPNFNKNYEIF